MTFNILMKDFIYVMIIFFKNWFNMLIWINIYIYKKLFG